MSENYLQQLISILRCLPKVIVTTIIYGYVPQYNGELLTDVFDIYDIVSKYYEYQQLNNFSIMHINIVSDELYVFCHHNRYVIYVINKKNKNVIRCFDSHNYDFMDVYNNEIFLCVGKSITIIDKNSGKFIEKCSNKNGDYTMTSHGNVVSNNDKIYFLDCDHFRDSKIHVFDKNSKEFSTVCIEDKYNKIYNYIAMYDFEMYIINQSYTSCEIKMYCLDIKNPTKIMLHYLDAECQSVYRPTYLIITDNEIFVDDYANQCVRIFNKFNKKYIRKIDIYKGNGTRLFRTQIVEDQIFISYDNKIHVFDRIIIN
jgi:hypothetical protein